MNPTNEFVRDADSRWWIAMTRAETDTTIVAATPARKWAADGDM